MQDLVGGDNNRTPVIFQGIDNLVFFGVIGNWENKKAGPRLTLLSILLPNFAC